MKYTGKPLQYSLEEHLNISNFISSVYKTSKQLDDFPLARFEIWVYEHYNENMNFFADNCHIWRDENGEIAGIFISEDGENGFHLINHPHNTEIFEIMVSFLENPAESCHLFRFKVAGHSGRKLPPIPV
ncbi:hypothetical protein [Spirochaeta isovalerica]|uniref:Uncharacterized protein n=1 Tax=Spirochaeta isovalerica TaxID=150 RepID=A0A841RJ10_9SPIO|nr:hypothetical protein [Spirochaeta isovalerica]MBB6482699.1 hypothetical protein [Spirochaeta isovalerica]